MSFMKVSFEILNRRLLFGHELAYLKCLYKIGVFDPLPTRVFGCRVLDLKEQGMSEEEAMAVATEIQAEQRKYVRDRFYNPDILKIVEKMKEERAGQMQDRMRAGGGGGTGCIMKRIQRYFGRSNVSNPPEEGGSSTQAARPSSVRRRSTERRSEPENEGGSSTQAARPSTKDRQILEKDVEIERLRENSQSYSQWPNLDDD
ncbi:hypothetical protein LguiB_016074 [Lonicera macranthoides]